MKRRIAGLFRFLEQIKKILCFLSTLEKAFSKLEQGSRGTYFINAKSAVEKRHIQHTKLTLKLEIAVDGVDGHTYDTYWRGAVTTDENILLDNLHDLENSVN